MSELAVSRAYHFSAAHRLANPALSDEENAAVYGQCFRQHGHNYGLEVTVAGPLDPATGMSVDLAMVDATVKAAVLDRVDHYDLSATVPALGGVITTGENLARTFWDWLEAALPAGMLKRVTVVETANNVFEYCGEGVSDGR